MNKKKIKKVIKLVAKNVKDLKDVSRKELSSAFRSAINSLPVDVREAIEAQYESYLSELERRVTETRRKEVYGKTRTHHMLDTGQIWKQPNGMSDQEAEKIRCCLISKKLRKEQDVRGDLQLSKTYEGDQKVLFKLGCASKTLESLKNVMKIYIGLFQTEMDRVLPTENVPEIEQLADSMEEYLRLFGMKYGRISNKKEKSTPTYGDMIACVCSLCLDLRTKLSRNLEKKEKKISARKLCGFLSFLVPDEFKLDVLMQTMEVTQEDEKFLWPFIQKFLKEQKVEGNSKLYLKYLLSIVIFSKKFPEAMDEYKQAARRIPAPSDFISWVSAHNPVVMDSIPTDRKFVGCHITKFLLEDVDDDLMEQLLDVLTSGSEEQGDITEETSDVEIIGESETGPGCSAPSVDIFFIDTGKPKVREDVVVVEEEDEMDVDSGKGSNSPLISLSDEETEPALILEDALDEIGNILHTVEDDEADGSESEEEDEEVVDLTDSVLEKYQRSCGSAKERNRIKADNVKLHSKPSREESNIETEDIHIVDDVEEKEEDIEMTPKAPAKSLRSYSKKTPLVSFPKSAVWEMKDEQEEESEMEGNDSELTKSQSKVRDSKSTGGKTREKIGEQKESGTAEMVSLSEDEKSEEITKKSKRGAVKSSPNVPKRSLRSYSKRTSSVSSESSAMKQGDKMRKGEQMEGEALDSMVSDSCDSEMSDDINIPNIQRNVGHVIISDSSESFMSPVIKNVQTVAKKSARKRILQEEGIPSGDKEPDVDEAFTKILSPPKSKLFAKNEPKKEAAGHMTRFRSRRKTTCGSDLSSENKVKNLKRRSLAPMCSLDSTPEKNTKITEYFERTPIRTRGKVICKDKKVEMEDKEKLITEREGGTPMKGRGTGESSGIKRSRIRDASQQNAEESPKKNRRDSRAHTENIGKLSVIKTRSHAENEGTDKRKLTPVPKNVTSVSVISVKPTKSSKTRSQSQPECTESKSDKNNDDEISSGRTGAKLTVEKKPTPKKSPRKNLRSSTMNDETVKKKPTPKKTPRKNLRSSTIFMNDEISVVETFSSSNDSLIHESPRKSTRTTKKM